MTIYIEPDYIKRIEDENEQLKERLKRESFYYEWQNTLEENEQLKEQVDNLRQDLQNRCDRCIELNDEKRYWLDNFKRVRDDKMKLIDEREKLKEENKQLQQELFNLYLKHYN